MSNLINGKPICFDSMSSIPKIKGLIRKKKKPTKGRK
jgi:hypothetical protein